MKTYFLPALRLTLVCVVFFAGVYTTALWAIAQVAAPNHGNGQVVQLNGKTVGYALVGQAFTQDRYFYSRPSAVGYNAAAAGGSNKGPSNPDYLKQVQQAIDTFMVHNPGVKREEIPSELVTASGSGLDPDISPVAAMVQVSRIAKIRRVNENDLIMLINKYTQKPLLGMFGTSHINVLQLNIALDNLKK